MEGILAILGIFFAPFFMIVAVVAIVHHYKLEAMRLQASQRHSAGLERKLDELRTDYEQFILGFDARLKKLEGRLSRIEGQVQQSLTPPTETVRSATPAASDTEAVSLRRIEP